MTRCVQRRGFTLLELLVVVMIVLVITGTGAVALTSKVPYMKLKGQASRVLGTLRIARERALSEGKTWKVRFHQVVRCATATDLFAPDTMTTYGQHQFVFSAPVECWHRQPASATTQQDVLPSTVFPAVLRPWPNYDVAITGNVTWVPIMQTYGIAATFNPPGTPFPRSLASIKLDTAFELDPDVRITRINERQTFANAGSYGTVGFDQPVPASPNALTGTPQRPLVRAAAPYSCDFYDDRIADVTYSPDGVFKFTPCPDTPAAPSLNPQFWPDMTIEFATFEAAASANYAPPNAITITIDRTTGFPHF
ncbi:MAG: prepilin-type N-terminal cleavage/methylation domain-containing protein [Candidatus Riflebacteria bacterium]|nr:prepilin-type N-terminal cleavage/methylation domain-containing protein [Candidatus Riflebacteria bacterium]